MAMYSVKWHPDKRDPSSSYWYECEGVITYASGLLKQWEGGSHKALVHFLHKKGKEIYWLSRHCVPPTIKYHKELLACTEALLDLLNQRSQP